RSSCFLYLLRRSSRLKSPVCGVTSTHLAWQGAVYTTLNGHFRLSFFLRKEVIQPHLPIRLPCYDFTPIIGPTFGCWFHKWLPHRLRVMLTLVVGRAVYTMPGNVFTAAFCSAITIYSCFIHPIASLQSVLRKI